MNNANLGKTDYDLLLEWILDLPDVTKAPHRFGGNEFQVHGLEFMHFHERRHLDIRLSRNDQKTTLTEGKAERHLFAPQAGWVTFRIRSPNEIKTAKELIRLAYDNAKGIMELHRSRLPMTDT